MIDGIFVLFGLTLFCVVCVRHFLIQMIAFKLLVDLCILVLVFTRGVDQSAAGFYALTWFFMAFGTLVLFVAFSVGIRKSRESKQLRLTDGTK